MSDLLEFLDKYNVDYTQTGSHARSGWVQILEPGCPKCDSTRGHLGIKLDGSRAACYKCSGFHVPTLLHTLTKAPWQEIRAVCQAGIYVPREEVKEATGVFTPPTHMKPLTEAGKHSRYMAKERKLDPAYCEKVWGCMATGPWSNHPFRVFIPITHKKKPVAWTARAIAGQEPKYQTSNDDESTMSPKRLLFGADKARGAIIITEGPLSAMKLGVGAVATLGVAVTQAQVALMLDFNRRFICFDSEPMAQRRATELADQLAAFPGETHIMEIDAADPGEITDSERELVRKCVWGRVAEW